MLKVRASDWLKFEASPDCVEVEELLKLRDAPCHETTFALIKHKTNLFPACRNDPFHLFGCVCDTTQIKWSWGFVCGLNVTDMSISPQRQGIMT
jgi:hypothetical protein